MSVAIIPIPYLVGAVIFAYVAWRAYGRIEVQDQDQQQRRQAGAVKRKVCEQPRCGGMTAGAPTTFGSTWCYSQKLKSHARDERFRTAPETMGQRVYDACRGGNDAACRQGFAMDVPCMEDAQEYMDVGGSSRGVPSSEYDGYAPDLGRSVELLSAGREPKLSEGDMASYEEVKATALGYPPPERTSKKEKEGPDEEAVIEQEPGRPRISPSSSSSAAATTTPDDDFHVVGASMLKPSFSFVPKSSFEG